MIALIGKKARQLSKENYNIIAVDITHMPFGDFNNQYNWFNNLEKILETEISRKIGGVFLFSRMTYNGKKILDSAFYSNQKSYKPLPSEVKKSLINKGNKFKILTKNSKSIHHSYLKFSSWN